MHTFVGSYHSPPPASLEFNRYNSSQKRHSSSILAPVAKLLAATFVGPSQRRVISIVSNVVHMTSPYRHDSVRELALRKTWLESVESGGRLLP